LHRNINLNGGSSDKENRGNQKLAYPIKQVLQGYYVIIEFDCETENIKPFERSLRLIDEVLRHMIITKKDGIALCNRFKNENFIRRDPDSKESLIERNLGSLYFDKILLDAPCSGEGTIRSTPRTLEMWNIKTIENLSKLQKSLIASAIEILKPNGELVYSTCTHAPEENEEIIDFALKNFKVKVEKISLPLKTLPGITKFGEKEYLEDVKYSCRVYPQTGDTHAGFSRCRCRSCKCLEFHIPD